MEAVVLLACLIPAGGLVGALFWYMAPRRTFKRRMREVPVREIAELKTGETARVVGVVACAEPVPAPLTKRPCAYWQVLVEEKQRTNSITHWAPIVEEHGGVDFLIVDATGAARVIATQVNPQLEQDGRFTSGAFEAASTEVKAFLAQRGHSTKGLFFNKAMRYREGVIEVGERITVVGRVRFEDDPDAKSGADYRSTARPKRAVLARPLLVSDEPDAAD